MKYPLFKPRLDTDEILLRLRAVLDSGYINEGIQVQEFKQQLIEKLGHKHVTPTSSCTAAISMALKLAGVKAGDEVVTTSMTCIATNTPVLWMGAKIVWADICKETGNIDPEEVKRKISKKTKAVICVNWAGIPCELEKLWKICKENNVKLIQDAAHSFGATLHEKDVSHFADFTCYSFQAIKHITCGDGGAIICNSNDDYLKARAMKWFGFDREAVKDTKGDWKGQRWEADVLEAGNKFHMNNISATIGLTSLAKSSDIISAHKHNAQTYNKLFQSTPLITPLEAPLHSDPAYWVYSILLDETIDRDYIAKKMNELGINAGLVHVPNHPYTCFRDSACKLPMTNYFAKHQLSLPCGWWLNSGDIEYIAQELKNVCQP